jgi:UDP-N-acetylglucosamine--N-acetylmuramyl-(pentapeptide) pyrophosphoryl-undecaprenol N-acetylglucosamine transferase
MEEDLVKQAGVPFHAIPAAGVHGVGLRQLPGNIIQLIRGIGRARGVIRDFQPQVMFFTGGYVAVPVALAGLGVPSVLFVPDIEPGLALRTLAVFADHITVTTEASRVHFSSRKKVTVTGYPTRTDLTRWTRREAYQALDLNPEEETLLVFGGSKGARSINQALIAALPDLLPRMQIIHISGHLDWPQVKEAQQDLSPESQARYRAYPYLHEKMGAALTAADLVLSRAGASILGEFPLFELPAILVPYPHAWRYQKVNAEYLVEKGGAVLLPDQELPDRLTDTVVELLEEPDHQEGMKQAMRDLKKPGAAGKIAQVLCEYGSERMGENCL